jgi:hypothetical protein
MDSGTFHGQRHIPWTEGTYLKQAKQQISIFNTNKHKTKPTGTKKI